MSAPRVRFAPSPTGYLHVGGARTALFNWLYARHSGGKFILRIEDTDVQRSTDTSTQQILDGLQWLGLDYDEFYKQSNRLDIYKEYAMRLLTSGAAYWCDCSAKLLATERQAAQKAGLKPCYSGRCRDRGLTSSPAGKVLRFRSPSAGVTTWSDLVYGDITVSNTELDDLIVLRSDGIPTYNFCVVVDDALMAITHVIRGEDHISNTPRQLQLYTALGFTAPQFAHIPMILGPDKKRLSKRHGASSVLEYRDLGYLPESLVNYLALLGWSHGRDEEFTVQQLVSLFSLDPVSRTSTVFNQQKLDWLNGRVMQQRPVDDLLRLAGLRSEFAAGAPLFIQRSKTLVDLKEQMAFLDPAAVIEYDPKATRKFFNAQGFKVLTTVLQQVQQTTFTEPELHVILDNICQTRQLKMLQVAQPIRLALTGRITTPGIYDIMLLLGKDLVIQRIQECL